MANLKVNFTKDAEFNKFIGLIENFDRIPSRMLKGVGVKAAYVLRKMYLSGRYLHFTNYRTKGAAQLFSAKQNRSMITVKVNRRQNKVHISSFPSNLFEVKRRGYKDKPIYRGIVRKKLKAIVSGDLDKWSKHYIDLIVKDILG